MRYIRLKQLMAEYVPVGKTTIYQMIKRDNFPAPVKFGKTSAWNLDEVVKWQAEQPRSVISNRGRAL